MLSSTSVLCFQMPISSQNPTMASLCHRESLHFPPLLSRPVFLKPFSSATSASPPPSLPLKPSSSSLSLRASFSPNPPSEPSRTSNVLPLAAAALTAAAALFLARLRSPAPALAAVAFSPPAAAATTSTVEAQDSSLETPSDAEKERILEEHLAVRPDDVRALRALMELKVTAGKLPEAIGIVDRIIALEPDEKDLPLLKAHLQSYNGDTETAKQGFEELIEKDPLLVEAYHGLVMAASYSEDTARELDAIVNRIKNAVDVCKKRKRKEDLRDFKLLMAQIRVIEGKYEDSLKIYQELVKEEPKDFRPYLCQGIIYTLLMKKDEAEKQFQKYRGLVPKGHPYAQYFDDNMVAMKVFGQMEENRRKGALQS